MVILIEKRIKMLYNGIWITMQKMKEASMEFWDMSVDKLKGVGATRSKQLAKLNIHTVKDLVYFFPRSYEKRGDIRLISNASFDVPCSMILTVGTAVRNSRVKNNMTISKFRAFDDSGAIEVVFFKIKLVFLSLLKISSAQ